MTRAGRLVAHLALSTAAALAVASAARAQGAGEPWKVRGRVEAIACAGTRCATRQKRIRPLLRDRIGDIDLLGALCECPSRSCTAAGGATGVECTICGCDSTGACSGTRAIVDPAAFGAYEASPQGARFNLTNRRALRDVLRVCFDNPTLKLGGFRSVVRSQAGSLAFEEHVRLSFSYQVRGQPVAVSAAGVFHGTQVLTSGARAGKKTRRMPLSELVGRVLAP